MQNLLFKTCFVLCLAAVPAAAQGIGGGLQVQDEATQITEHLGEQLDLNLRFRDENDREVKLSEYVNGKRAVLLNIVYFRCPGMCGAITNGMLDGLKDIADDDRIDDIVPGRHVEILTVSFDPEEYDKRKLVEAKKGTYLNSLAMPGAEKHWHFLRGDKDNAKALTEAVGFGYRWNQTTSQYDHSSVLILLSPTGKITRYLYGESFDQKTLRLAVVEASDGKVGTTLEKILLSCYDYDPNRRDYSAVGSGTMFIGGVLTLLGIGAMMFILWRQGRRQQPVPSTP